MRLSKRIAAVALAAVMAVSMLTACGGGGGGRPNMAQAGGKDASKIADALEKAKEIIAEQMK